MIMESIIMKKSSFVMAIAAVMSAAVLMSGCTKRGEILESVAAENPIPAGTEEKPDLEIHDDIVKRLSRKG